MPLKRHRSFYTYTVDYNLFALTLNSLHRAENSIIPIYSVCRYKGYKARMSLAAYPLTGRGVFNRLFFYAQACFCQRIRLFVVLYACMGFYFFE